MDNFQKINYIFGIRNCKNYFGDTLMSTSTVKVYETSIIPPGSQIEPVREAKNVASSMTIEVFHVLCFLGVFAFIFAGIWRRAVAQERAAKNQVSEGVKA